MTVPSIPVEVLMGVRVLCVNCVWPPDRDPIDILQAQGAEVVSVDAGQTGEFLRALGPDIVLVTGFGDTRTPKDEFSKLLRSLRSISAHGDSGIPIIATMGDGSSSARHRAFEVGIRTVLVAPFQPEQLVAVVATLMNRATAVTHEAPRRSRRGTTSAQKHGMAQERRALSHAH